MSPNSLTLGPGSSTAQPAAVNHITVEHPWQWLQQGWQDIRTAPGYSLTYGSAIVVLSIAITVLMTFGHVSFLLPFMIAGFFLLAPLLAIGLYQMSSNLEQHKPLSQCQALQAFQRNQSQLGILAVFLTLLMQTWILSSVVLFLLLFDAPFPTLGNFVPTVFFSGHHLLLSVVLIGVGGACAACAFCLSAITVPMLIDRRIDVMTAMSTSFTAVRANWQPMMLWAALIVAITGVGLLTFYVGLFLAVPLIGHASWHAYRDLIPAEVPGR